MNKKDRKKAIIVAVLIVALLIWMASLVLADGGGSSTIVQPVTLSDLGVSNTGLLPGNPFYFSEDWMRDLQRIFTTDSAARSELELQILNDKAAELLITSEVNPVNADDLSDAIDNYSNELQVMSTDIQLLNTKSADVDSLLSDLTTKLLMHYQMLEAIKIEDGDSDGSIGSAQGQINTIIGDVPNSMSDSSKFEGLLNNAIAAQTDDLGINLRVLPFVDGLEEASSDTSTIAQLDQVRQDQVLEFEGRFDADGLSPNIIPGILAQLPVSDLNKIKLVGDVRNFVVDNGLRSELDSVTSTLLMQASSSGEISPDDVSNLANYAGVLIGEAGDGKQSSDLLEASTLLLTSKTDLANGLYGAAFSEASDAASIADGIVFSSEEAAVNSKNNISDLSNRLSVSASNAVAQGLVNIDDPKLFTLFGEATSTLSGKPSVNDIYGVEESLDEINFALDSAQEGLPSALIPVPGENSLQNATNGQPPSTAIQVGTSQYCSEVYEPVCGSDGMTYSNRCFEGLAGVDSTYKGECKLTSTSTVGLVGSTGTTTAQGSN